MHFLSSLFRIVIIDLVLSGDNAVVIGMAAHRLNPRERKTAILVGGGAAIGLRILLTAIATLLLRLPGLRLVGGILLLWIGFKMLKQEEEDHGHVKAAGSMREAIVTILVADFIMSTDNVLGVAGASEGNIALLLFGLVLSMAILLFMGSLVADMVTRFWWLAYVGSAVIVWTGAAMIFEDPIVAGHVVEWGRGVELATKLLITAGTLFLAHRVRRAES